ncbi:hypothetical protein [Crassaminicella thermophila]|nr:hypothetical protein [Crassaminicella thermophila]
MPKKIKFRNVVTGTVIEAYAEMAEYYKQNPCWKIEEEEKC